MSPYNVFSVNIDMSELKSRVFFKGVRPSRGLFRPGPEINLNIDQGSIILV